MNSTQPSRQYWLDASTVPFQASCWQLFSQLLLRISLALTICSLLLLSVPVRCLVLLLLFVLAAFCLLLAACCLLLLLFLLFFATFKIG